MNDGDFIKINFEMYVGEDRKLVSTNNEQLAKDNSIFDEKLKYKETVLIVGSENLFPEINESFRNAETGKDYEVVITAENAYGVRDSKNIRVHTVREFQRQKEDGDQDIITPVAPSICIVSPAFSSLISFVL